MRRFEEADLVADVGAGRHAEPADLRRAGVGQVVAVQVGRREHVVVGGAGQHLLEHAVGDAVVDEDLALARRAGRDFVLGHDLVAELGLRHLVAPVAERALGELHDVALVHDGDGLPLLSMAY